jgi:geranylgeranyl pyrophosphate synthase
MSSTANPWQRAIAGPAEIKAVPQECDARQRIRTEARNATANLPRHRPLRRQALEDLARQALQGAGLDGEYLGFAMVAVSNEFWREQFLAVACSRRLLLLPHCLRDPVRCQGNYTAVGLECAGCGACELAGLKAEAEELGYKVLIAEGTPAVVEVVLSGRADAILGVACLDSLEKAFTRVVEMGIPHVALPLLADGCRSTTAELDLVREWMGAQSGPVRARTRSYVPLLRAAESIFDDGELDTLLADFVRPESLAAPGGALAPASGTEALAVDWLRCGGKRFRPFITLASYAALVHGTEALDPAADLGRSFPDAVRRTAVAIEALHKASLVHDDIEDDDLFRYGRKTLHRSHGVANAINVGDFLIGLGYRLVGAADRRVDAAATADILNHLAEAHLRLCRGQGAELLWRSRSPQAMRPLDLLAVYALKTAPAFEAAMYAGIRLALADLEQSDGPAADPATIRPFCRYLGVAYQVLNDLKDWDRDNHDKLVAGQDSIAARPTVLLAFALDAGDEAANRELLRVLGDDAPEETRFRRLRDIYLARGVFDTADRLVEKYRQRARAEADAIQPHALRELMHFVIETVL